MKKNIILLLLCALFITVNAQEETKKTSDVTGQELKISKNGSKSKCETPDCQKMMQLKREFMRENFKIEDEDQNKAFWNAYKMHETAEFEIFKKSQKQKAEAGLPEHVRPEAIDSLPDEQIVALFRIKIEAREMKAQAEKKFFEEISNILTAKQLSEYYQLDKKFKHTAVRKGECHKGERRDASPADKVKPMPINTAPQKIDTEKIKK